MSTRVRDGSRWGGWQLQGSDHTLALHHGADYYQIDLDSITDSAQMLDWVYQVRLKTWATNETVSSLLNAFQDLFDPQANLCSGSQSKTINAKQHLDRVIAYD